MRIVVDTAEQAPLHFHRETVRKSLDTGDYSIEGLEGRICVERKSLSDLVKSVVTDWLRFSRCCRRMAAMDVAAIVVEAPITALMHHQYVGDILPQSVRGKLNAIHLDFGVPTLFLDNREIAAEWVENLFEQFERRQVSFP